MESKWQKLPELWQSHQAMNDKFDHLKAQLTTTYKQLEGEKVAAPTHYLFMVYAVSRIESELQSNSLIRCFPEIVQYRKELREFKTEWELAVKDDESH